MKKIMSLLIASLLVLPLLLTTLSSCGEKTLEFTLNPDGESYSVGVWGNSGETHVEIPSTYKKKPVTAIIKRVRKSSTNSTVGLESVTIPNSVTKIETEAFRGFQSLKSVKIPNSVVSIGDQAFAHCYSLESVEIPDSVVSIGKYAFYFCESLDNVIIPNSVTAINDHTFSQCISLTNVVIPNSVTSIGNRAFEGCDSLTSVTIPDSVTSIGYWAFYSCASLTSVTFANPNGWWGTEDSNATSGTDIAAESLADPATAAKYLRSLAYYGNYYWYRTE